MDATSGSPATDGATDSPLGPGAEAEASAGEGDRGEADAADATGSGGEGGALGAEDGASADAPVNDAVTSEASGGDSAAGDAGASDGAADGFAGGDGAAMADASADGGMNTGDAGASNPESDASPEIDPTMTRTLTMGAFNVAPGDEVWYCQTFASPWDTQVDVKTYSVTMGPGAYGMFAFYDTSDDDAGGATPCPAGGLTFGAFTFMAQTSPATLAYPDTVGARIPEGTGFNLMVHYLNVTSSTIQGSLSLTMYVATAGTVSNPAGIIFLNNTAISVVANGQPLTNTASYVLPQNVDVIGATSITHSIMTSFVATASSGQQLFTTTTFLPTMLTYAPPLLLDAGTTITWSCTDVNSSGATITFGEGETANAMCVSVEPFYPARDPSNPVVGSSITGL